VGDWEEVTRWKWIALLMAAAAVATTLGVVFDLAWVLAIATVPLALAPAAGFAYLTRNTKPAGRAYRDQNYVGGILTVFGFSPTEQDAARAEAELEKQPPASPRP
jgi:hypothetical protein